MEAKKLKAVPTEEMSEDDIKREIQELTLALALDKRKKQKKLERMEERIEKLTKEIDGIRKRMDAGFIVLLIVNVIIFFALLVILYFTK